MGLAEAGVGGAAAESVAASPRSAGVTVVGLLVLVANS